jgi:gas vesicle structural protein
MMTTAVQPTGAPGGGALDRPSGSGLAEIVDSILDKGLVIDAFVRVSVVGIELLTIDARVVVAGVDTYLRYAEAVNRLNLAESGGKGLPEFFEGAQEHGAQKKVKGAAKGALEAASDTIRDFADSGVSRRYSSDRRRAEDD